MAKRNRGKPHVRDLSRQPPTDEEANAVIKAFFNLEASPIVIAILGQAAVEHALDIILRTRFPRNDDSTWGRLTDETGPLATFASKITAGYAFKLYDEETRKNLRIVLDIRNVFAHSKRLIEFNNESIKRRLGEIELPLAKRGALYQNLAAARDPKLGPRLSYMMLCSALTWHLMGRHLRGSAAASRNRTRAMVRKYGPSYLDVLKTYVNRQRGSKEGSP
jgi:hypothetical protein